jgi:hypothetical protein
VFEEFKCRIHRRISDLLIRRKEPVTAGEVGAREFGTGSHEARHALTQVEFLHYCAMSHGDSNWNRAPYSHDEVEEIGMRRKSRNVKEET